MKYILVTSGGVETKDITSSIGILLKASKLRVTVIKIDTYICKNPNVSPHHRTRGVFVLKDGSEVDQDFEVYQRLLDMDLTGDNHMTTRKIYQLVINRERRGDYLGKTVQTVPHITDCIQDWIKRVANERINQGDQSPDVCIIELGGPVQRTQCMAFTEALRQFASDNRREDFCCIHVDYVPLISEHKTKVLQSNVAELRKLISNPNMIICRSEPAISDDVRKKIHNSCGVRLVDYVISLKVSETIDEVPSELKRQDVIKSLAECLELKI